MGVTILRASKNIEVIMIPYKPYGLFQERLFKSKLALGLLLVRSWLGISISCKSQKAKLLLIQTRFLKKYFKLKHKHAHVNVNVQCSVVLNVD